MGQNKSEYQPLALYQFRNNVKKIFSEPKKISFAEIEKYRLPIYNRKGKEKFVYFYVLDPDSVIEGNPKLKRIRKKFNHIHSKKERDEAAHNPDFLLACQVHYYTLIRPNEQSNIRLEDISLKEQTIFVSKDISKNRKDGKVTLPAKVIRNMIDRKVFNQPGDSYLFGRNFKPSPNKADARIFREEWIKVREALNFPSYYQFYSLKDTGITDTIDRVGLSVAKDQARHSSVATTNKYVRKEQLTAHPELKNFEGNL